MKSKLYFSCTSPIMFLSELPLIFLLVLSIMFNDSGPDPIKLYPLIVTVAAVMVFIFVFFFRMVSLSWEELRLIGRFTSRDSAIIKKGKKLRLTIEKKNRLKIELFDDGGDVPGLDFLKNDPSYSPIGLNLFRASVVFGKGSLISILKYLGLGEEEIKSTCELTTYECNAPEFKLCSAVIDDSRTVDIEFIKTV